MIPWIRQDLPLPLSLNQRRGVLSLIGFQCLVLDNILVSTILYTIIIHVEVNKMYSLWSSHISWIQLSFLLQKQQLLSISSVYYNLKMFKAIVIFWLFCLFFIHRKCALIEYLLCYSPEEKIRQLEKKVNELIEESCFANSTGDLSLVQRILVLMFVKNCKAYAKSGLLINWFLIITATMKTRYQMWNLCTQKFGDFLKSWFLILRPLKKQRKQGGRKEF